MASSARDARWLLAVPVWVTLCVCVLVGDLDNVVFMSIKSLLVPGLLVIGGSRRTTLYKTTRVGTVGGVTVWSTLNCRRYFRRIMRR